MHHIAVVIPTKNEARYLPRLLSVLKGQTVLPDEVVVADAGSTDKTAEIARTFGATVVNGGSAAVGAQQPAQQQRRRNTFSFDADAIIDDHEFLAHALAEFNRRSLDPRQRTSTSKGEKRGDGLSMRCTIGTCVCGVVVIRTPLAHSC